MTYLHSTMVGLKLMLPLTFVIQLFQFTFHYGRIKTEALLVNTSRAEIDLHSTMVGLKRMGGMPGPMKDEKFTFHYGRIKTKYSCWNNIAYVEFTFHYGRIKT